MPDACVNFDHSGTKKAPQMRGFLEERMKGLEPSTFCMANGKANAKASKNAAFCLGF